MKDFFGKQLPYVATVSAEGVPNLGPKRTCRVLNDTTLIYNENTGKQTLKNILANGNISVAISDWGKLDGYRFAGKAEVYTAGEYFELCVKYAEEKKIAMPKAAVLVKIEKIYTLKSGAQAGDLIE